VTGPELNQLPVDLSEAIGRPLSAAKLCDLVPESGGDTIRDWENGDRPIGQ
jgi:hypothetical protein